MNIVVCAKVVPDYEVPASDFELVNGRAHKRFTRMIGLYDENAVEVGVQLKEKYNGNLIIISYGREEDIPILRKAIAMGGDKLIIIIGNSDDPYIISENLKMGIERIGDVDFVLAGRQSADMDRGIVPGILAGMLNYTFVPQVTQIELINGLWKAIQVTEKGIREIKVSKKAVFSITDDPGNIPRIPPVRRILAAKKMPVEKLNEIQVPPMQIEEISVDIPKIEIECEFLSVEDPKEAARALLNRLKEERYL